MKRGYIGMNRIPEFSKYCATRDGKIWSDHKNGFLKSNIRNKRGRLSERVKVTDDNGRERTMYIHRLVAMAWLPNTENKETVNHKDFNTLNNHVDNLEWMTRQENLNHARENNMLGASKYVFTPLEESAILELNRTGMNMSDIAKKYGCSSNVIRKVFDRNNIIPIRHGVRKFSSYDVLRMYTDQFLPIDVIAKKLNCTPPTVRNILKEHGVDSNRHTYITQRINSMYSNGISIDDIANTMSLDSSYVRKHINTLREEDVFKVESSYGISIEDYAEFCNLVNSGYSRDMLKKHFNVGKNALDTALRNNGLRIKKSRPNKNTRKYDYDAIYEMSKTMTQTAIAKKLKIAQPTVNTILKRHKRYNGIKDNHHGNYKHGKYAL